MADNSKAAVIPLTDEGKLRLVYLLLMHQKPISYDNFDPGTGHSIRAIQGIIERIGKKVATDPTPNKSVTPTAKQTPKKRGRPAAKTANAEDAYGETPSKKGRARKVVAKKKVEDEDEDEDVDAAEVADKEPPKKKGRKAAAKKETDAEDDDESKLIKEEPEVVEDKQDSAMEEEPAALKEDKQDSAVNGEVETVPAEAAEI